MDAMAYISERRYLLKQLLAGGALAVLGARRFAADAHAETKQPTRCDDTSGLTRDEVAQRKALKYTDRTPNSAQTCGNCMHLQPVPGSTGPCKRCSVLPGPVHIAGWCTAWVARVGSAG